MDFRTSKLIMVFAEHHSRLVKDPEFTQGHLFCNTIGPLTSRVNRYVMTCARDNS